ncbi:MAG: S8 family serine peptidase [Alphaproteobacteria bacterium]
MSAAKSLTAIFNNHWLISIGGCTVALPAVINSLYHPPDIALLPKPNQLNDPAGLCALAQQHRQERDALLHVPLNQLQKNPIGVADILEFTPSTVPRRFTNHGVGVSEIIGTSNKLITLDGIKFSHQELERQPVKIISRSIGLGSDDKRGGVAVGFDEQALTLPRDTIFVNSMGNEEAIAAQANTQRVITAPNMLAVGSLRLSGDQKNQLAPVDSFSRDDGVPAVFTVDRTPIAQHPDSNFCVSSGGTSFATPEVSALIAQLLTKYPDNPDMVIWAVLMTRTPLAKDPLIENSNHYGGGIINPTAADQLLDYIHEQQQQQQFAPTQIWQQQNIPASQQEGNIQQFRFNPAAHGQFIAPNAILIHHKLEDDSAHFNLQLKIYEQGVDINNASPLSSITLRKDANSRDSNNRINQDAWLRFDPLDATYRQQWKNQAVQYVVEVEWVGSSLNGQRPNITIDAEIRGFDRQDLLAAINPTNIAEKLPAIGVEMKANPYAYQTLAFAQKIEQQHQLLPANAKLTKTQRLEMFNAHDAALDSALDKRTTRSIEQQNITIASMIIGAGCGVLLSGILECAFISKESEKEPMKSLNGYIEQHMEDSAPIPDNQANNNQLPSLSQTIRVKSSQKPRW